MIRIIVGSLLAAIVVFVYGMMSWMVFCLHDKSIAAIPNSTAFINALQAEKLATGVYIYPMTEQATEAEATAWMEQHRQGPIVSIYYQREGAEPMGPNVMGAGFAINFGCALIASILLWMSRTSLPWYGQRVFFVALLGVFAAVICHVAMHVWMASPWSFVQPLVIDVIVEWVLGGLVLAAIVKQPRMTVPA